MQEETIEQIVRREIREKQIELAIYVREIGRLNKLCSELESDIKDLYWDIGESKCIKTKMT